METSKSLKVELEKVLKKFNVLDRITKNECDEIRLEFFLIISKNKSVFNDLAIQCTEYNVMSNKALMIGFDKKIENLTEDKLIKAIEFIVEDLNGEELGDNIPVELPEEYEELYYENYESIDNLDLEFAKKLYNADDTGDFANNFIIAERDCILSSCLYLASTGDYEAAENTYKGLIKFLF